MAFTKQSTLFWDEPKTPNPAAMTVEEAAKTLGVRREWLEADIAGGAPTNAYGTVNLVHCGGRFGLDAAEHGG